MCSCISISIVYQGFGAEIIFRFGLARINLLIGPFLHILGHRKAVKHLSVSLDGSTLVSGSDDNDVKLWHIPSRQCSRTITHKGIITASEFQMAPPRGFLDSTVAERFLPSLVLAPFEKTLYMRRNKNKTDRNNDSYSFQTFVKERRISEEYVNSESYKYYEPPRKSSRIESSLTSTSGDTLADENNKLKEINIELYQFAVQKVLGDRNRE